MSQVNPTNKPFLSKRQRRMLQDMGIDVFTMRTASADALAGPAQDARSATSKTRSRTGSPNRSKGCKKKRPAAQAVNEQQPAMPQSDAPPSAPLRIELNFVATPALTYVGETELSTLELRFVQDVASAAQWVATRSALKGTVRNSEFRWPIGGGGTPERAITVFCEKHGLLSRSAAYWSPQALRVYSNPAGGEYRALAGSGCVGPNPDSRSR